MAVFVVVFATAGGEKKGEEILISKKLKLRVSNSVLTSLDALFHRVDPKGGISKNRIFCSV